MIQEGYKNIAQDFTGENLVVTSSAFFQKSIFTADQEEVLVFKTMILGDSLCCIRTYYTENEAICGHQEIVDWLRSGELIEILS